MNCRGGALVRLWRAGGRNLDRCAADAADTAVPVHSELFNRRNYSLQTSVESAVKTQSGIFQSISESAVVQCAQKVLLNFHETTGLPWWATIICTTVAMRTTVTVPLAIYQQYILAKVENLNLEMPGVAKELKKEVAIAVKMYGWDERTAKIHYRRSVSRFNWNSRDKRKL